MTDDPVTVEIADVVPGAQVISRRELRVDDIVFDVYGGRHPVAKVRHYPTYTTFERSDGWPLLLTGDETITVIRA